MDLVAHIRLVFVVSFNASVVIYIRLGVDTLLIADLISFPLQKVFERFLLSLVDYTGHQRLKVLWQAARCMAFLPQIGGGGTGGTMHKCAWAAQQKSLCRTIHIILDDLYADSNELQVNNYTFLFLLVCSYQD